MKSHLLRSLLLLLMMGILMMSCTHLHERFGQPERNISLEDRYLLYLPEDYDTRGEWPLLLFLHGAGERGANLNQVKVHGPPKLIEGGRMFPFIVLAPQCPENQYWSIDFLTELLDHIESKYAVDSSRIYVTGLSMGGFGTWSLAIEQPQRIAAIAPICGGGDPSKAEFIKHIPTWVFHGAKDQVVPLSSSDEMVAALQAAKGNVRYTVYPEADHDSWTETYDNPNLYSWFLAQKLNN